MRIEISGHRSDPQVTWERLGDTDFMNRLVHGGKVEVHLREDPRGGAPSVTGTLTGPLGVGMAFEETANAWVRRRWFQQDRVYHRAPIAASRFRLELEPDGDGVIPHIHLELDPAVRLLSPVLSARAEGMRSGWQAVLDALPAPGAPVAPAMDRNPHPAQAAALDRWRPHAPAALVKGVQQLLQHARDQELREIRAYGLADQLGLDREETLAALVRAVPAGLLELYWSVRCTRCRGEVEATTSLSNLADHAGCPSCGVSFPTDLATSVEVLFAPHPSVLPRTAERFCTLFPTGAPSMHASLTLEPGGAVDEALQVAPGARFALGIGRGRADLQLRVDPAAGDHEVRWTPDTTGEATVAPGQLRIEAHNPTEARQRLVLLNTEADAHVVPAVALATLPEFRRELGIELLSSRIRVGSRRVALLFTDLSGSTAMYEALGDAAAYSVVRDHFELLRERVDAHHGAVVKTIGDAVMASFVRTDEAVRAALAMRSAFDAWITERHPALEVRLNVGVHVGMALAVHTDHSGLDWFGRHVNLAARAQGAAKNGDLVLTEAVLDDPLVASVLAPLGATEPFEAELKGIGPTRLHRLPRDQRG